MTPKEKAKELFKNIYSKIFEIDNGVNIMQDKKRFDAAKNCAYITIGEIISVCPYISKTNADTTEQLRADNIMFVEYWQQVKSEIDELVLRVNGWNIITEKGICHLEKLGFISK